MFSDTEAINFTYKKNDANQARGLYTHTYEKEELKPSDAIAAKQWRIDISSMNTLRYGSRIVTPDFYLELKGDTLCSYLPYLGQAQVSPMLSPSIGLNFEEPVLSYTMKLEMAAWTVSSWLEIMPISRPMGVTDSSSLRRREMACAMTVTLPPATVDTPRAMHGRPL